MGGRRDFWRVDTENIKKGKKFSSGYERNPDDDGDCQCLNMMDNIFYCGSVLACIICLHFYPQLLKHSKVLLESAYNLTMNLRKQCITRYI